MGGRGTGRVGGLLTRCRNLSVADTREGSGGTGRFVGFPGGASAADMFVIGWDQLTVLFTILILLWGPSGPDEFASSVVIVSMRFPFTTVIDTLGTRRGTPRAGQSGD